MTYIVYADCLEDVRKKLDRMAQKAERYSIPFSYTVGQEHPRTVYVYDESHIVGQPPKEYTVAAVSIDVDCDGFIQQKGWTVCARLEHGEHGNIVTPFGDCKPDPTWFSAAPHCDHCQTNRFRSVTFFCRNSEGNMRQVGRTCLKDYTGIDPKVAVLWAEVQDIIDSNAVRDCSPEEWEERGITPVYDVVSVLAHAWDSIQRYGYRKSSELESTKSLVTSALIDHKATSDEGLRKAEEIKDWLISLDPESASDLERNCISLALNGYARRHHIGLLAYMPMAYEKYMEREARRMSSVSTYVGEVGQRLTIVTVSAKLVTSWENYYGTTYLYRFTDQNGNVYIWRASYEMDISDGMTIKGTVKDHNEYDGVKQTVITRCAVA